MPSTALMRAKRSRPRTKPRLGGGGTGAGAIWACRQGAMAARRRQGTLSDKGHYHISTTGWRVKRPNNDCPFPLVVSSEPGYKLCRLARTQPAPRHRLLQPGDLLGSSKRDNHTATSSRRTWNNGNHTSSKERPHSSTTAVVVDYRLLDTTCKFYNGILSKLSPLRGTDLWSHYLITSYEKISDVVLLTSETWTLH